MGCVGSVEMAFALTELRQQNNIASGKLAAVMM